MKNIFKTLILIGLVFTLLLTSCSFDKANECLLVNAIYQIDTSNTIQQLHDYDSPYTICYQNSDNTYSVYIFSSPIQFNTENGYEIIDNTIVESSDPNYAFENKANKIKTYFPLFLCNSFKVVREDDFIEFTVEDDVTGFSDAKQQMFMNMYGDMVSAVVYERSDMNMVFYPTKAGIKSEIVLKQKIDDNQHNFHVTTNGTSYQNDQNGYILISSGEEKVGLIYSPLIKGSMDKYDENDNNISIKSNMHINREEDGYAVSISIDEGAFNNEDIYPISFDPSFELYLSKQPDSGIYSKKQNENSYLREISVIGNSDSLGIGMQYMRFRLNNFINIDKDSIISSFYHISELSGFTSRKILNLHKMHIQWSSTGLCWINKVECGEKISTKKIKKSGDIAFDITKYTWECFTDTTCSTESYGLLLEGTENKNSYRIFASSDNSLYSPYVEITLKSLPIEIICIEDINSIS